MSDWNEDNFLERLMPQRRSGQDAAHDSCPDAGSLCAYAEDRLRGVAHDAIAAHVKECKACAEIYERLLNFASPRTALAESEWIGVEKRLGNWMDSFLHADSRRRREAARQEQAPASSRRGWLSTWKVQWALGICAGLAVAAVAALVVETSVWRHYTGTTVALRPSATISAQNEQQLPLPSQAAPGAANYSNQVTNPSTGPASGGSAVPGQTQPSVPGAANLIAPVSGAPPPNGSAAQSQPTQAPPPADQSAQAMPATPNGGYQSAAVVAPEVKAELAGQVKSLLVADQVAAANPAPPYTNSVVEAPSALAPAQRLFIVSGVLNEPTADGQQCSLVSGDILTRVMDTPDANMKVTALVTSSQRGDCASGSLLAVSVSDLQEMQNDFMQKMEDGLQRLAENEGKAGMPASPDAGVRANPYGQAQPDSTVQADLQQQQEEAGNVEGEVEQATEGYTPSAFHRAPPTDSEHLSRASADSQRISPYGAAASGGLTLIAWTQGPNQPSARPQQNAPARPAPAPKSPPPTVPGSANRSAAAPQPHPSTSPRPANTSPVSRPASAPKNAHGSVTRGSVPASGRFIPPHGATAMPDGRGGMSYTMSDGTQFHVGSTGRITSLATRSGATAEFTSSGRIASIRTTQGMMIYRSANGQQRIETVRTDGTRVVSTGRNSGFIERPFARGGQIFVRRTYLAGGHSYARLYGRYTYRSEYIYKYIPAHYFAPAFYGWACNPWPAAVRWSWNWGAEAWYGFYGYYFAPYPYYAGPVFWLTDYLLAANLQAAYQAQAEATSFAIPEQFAFSGVHSVAKRFEATRNVRIQIAAACDYERRSGHDGPFAV
jgi:hypothetical protein